MTLLVPVSNGRKKLYNTFYNIGLSNIQRFMMHRHSIVRRRILLAINENYTSYHEWVA